MPLTNSLPSAVAQQTYGKTVKKMIFLQVFHLLIKAFLISQEQLSSRRVVVENKGLVG